MRIGSWSFLTGPEPFPDMEGDTFMVMYPVVRAPSFAIVLRKILKPNVEAHLHTHGFPYVTFILTGGYIEQRRDGRFLTHGRFTFNHIPQEDAHKILRVFGTTWTLGLHMKWRAKPESTFGMEVDGKVIPIWDYMKEHRVRPTR